MWLCQRLEKRLSYDTGVIENLDWSGKLRPLKPHGMKATTRMSPS